MRAQYVIYLLQIGTHGPGQIPRVAMDGLANTNSCDVTHLAQKPISDNAGYKAIT